MSSTSALLVQLRQSFRLRGKATFWFGGVIAAVVNFLDKNQQTDINNDKLNATLQTQFLQILNHTFVSAMLFYSQNLPDNFFRFIAFCHSIVSGKNNKNNQRSFNVVMGRLSLRNNILIQALRRKQYNQVIVECQQLMREMNESGIDCYNLCYVTFLSNFLSIVSKLDMKRTKQMEVKYLYKSIVNNLVIVLGKIIEKYQKIANGEGSIDLAEFQIIIAVFVKHKPVLEDKLQSQLQNVISHIIPHTKYHSITSSIYVQKIYKQKIQRSALLTFQLPFYQFNCLSFIINLPSKTSNKLKNKLSTSQESQKQDSSQNQRLLRIQKMLQQHLSTINQFNNKTQIKTLENHSTISSDLKNGKAVSVFSDSKNGKIETRFRKLKNLSSTLNKDSQSIKMNNTIQINEFDLNQSGLKKLSSQQMDKGSQFLTERKIPRFGYNYGVMQHMVSPTKVKNPIGRMETKKHHNLNLSSVLNNHSQINSQFAAHPLIRTHNVLHFKMGSIFIEVNDDGMLFSDYTKQNKRYVEWNTISQILLRVQYKFIYKSYLSEGIFNYYDVIRILKLYLSKSQVNTITVNQYPNMILQLNEFIRFYQQDGRFTKLAHMNIYDNTKLQSEIDCYLEEFDHFFKIVSSDGYLEYLEQKVFRKSEKQKNVREQVFYLEVLRKHNDSIRLELQNQLTVDIVQSVTNDRQFLYRALFILKNNVRLYAKIQFTANKQKKQISTNKPQSESQNVTITIKKLSQNNLPFIRHTIPCHIFYHYIPLGELSPAIYIRNYGRLIFQSFNNFENISDESMGSAINFEIITHCYQSEMIEIGKYWTVCSAEIIGSKKTVYGMVIRYAFLPMNKDFITFLRNPYCGFLSSLISMTKQEKKESLRNLLIEESVKQTYLYLERSKKLNQVSSLIEYLSEGLGIK